MRRQRLALSVVGIPAAVALLIPQGLWVSSRQGMQGYLAFATALELALLLGSLLLVLHAGVSIAWERSEKTLRDALAGPVHRGEILFSRWLALQAEMLLLLALVAVLAFASTLVHYRFEDIRGDAIEPLFYARELARHTALGIAYFIPPAFALVTLGLLASVLSASPAMAATLALGALFCLDISKSVFSSASGVVPGLFNSYLPSLFDQTSYLHGVTAMANGIGDVLWSDTGPERHLGLLVPAAYTAVFLLVSLAVFSTRDYAE